MDIELTKYLGGLGVGGLIALIIYYQGDKNSKAFQETIKSMYHDEKNRAEQMLIIVKENTVAFTRNTLVVESLHRRLDNELNHHRSQDRINVEGDTH